MFGTNSKNKRIFVSLTALLLIVALAVGFTYGWSEGGDRADISGNNITISSGSNLTMRQDDKITSSIIIPACTLEETSSVDGRNFFFPLGNNTTSNTSTMSFREGVASDVNTKYISVDFELEAGEKPVDVYLGAGTIIQCESKELLNALRLAFYYNDGSDPLIFKPNQMPGVEMEFSPIATIEPVSGDATLVSTPVVTEAFGSYYYKGDDKSTPLFTLEKDETKNISLAIWLEGTEFTSADIAGKNLDIYIDFTTTVDDLIRYVFIDNCHSRNSAELNQWVSNNMEVGTVDYETMMYLYDKTAERYYALEKQVDESDPTVNTHTWIGYIPKTIRDFYFRRYSIDIDEWWNEWEPDMANIPTINNTRTYVAIAGQETSEGENLDGCYGYWKDQYGTYRIYFQLECAWNDLHCYAWNTSGKASATTGAYPGIGMTFVRNVDDDPKKPLYYIDLKESENIDGLTFNNGKTATTIYLGKNYGANTHAYVFGSTGEVFGAWPGAKAQIDPGTGMYYVNFNTGTAGTEFYVVVNNGNGGSGNQFPESGGYMGYTGNAYEFYEGSFEPVDQKYDVKNETFDNYIFNGSIFWYKTDSENGFTTYLRSKDSKIFPFNDPTPDTKYIDN